MGTGRKHPAIERKVTQFFGNLKGTSSRAEEKPVSEGLCLCKSIQSALRNLSADRQDGSVYVEEEVQFHHGNYLQLFVFPQAHCI